MKPLRQSSFDEAPSTGLRAGQDRSVPALRQGSVPAGYKQTDVGVIPEEWEVEKLGNVSAITTGRKDVNEGNPTGEYPFFTCSRSRTFSDHYSFDTEAILIAGNGDVGNLHYYSGKFEAYQRTYVVHKFSRSVRYIWHQLDYRIIESLGLGKIGTSIPYIKKENLTGLVFPIPSSETEQCVIAEALSDVDELLVALDRLIAKKRDLKQAAMQQLLTPPGAGQAGQTRLPGFHGEWEVKTLQESTDCLDGVRVPLNEAQRAQRKGDYPYCGANGVLDYVNSYVIDDEIILMAEDGGYFDEYENRPIAYRMSGKCWVNNHAHILKAKPGFDQGFIFYSLVHKNILPFLASGTRAKLNKSEMNKIEVRVPKELPEQTAIAGVLRDMDAELAALEQRREKTRALKQGMMQELLTGRTRLV